MCSRGTLLGVMEFQQIYPINPFVTNDACLTPVCQLVQFLFLQYIEKYLFRFDIDRFEPDLIFCGLIPSPIVLPNV